MPDAAVVAIGKQALGFTSSGASSPTTKWSSSAKCPDSIKQGMLASVPAGTTVTTLDAVSTSGVPGAPGATAGDVPSCAYSMDVSGRRVDELIFIGMDSSYQSAIVASLEADGFVAGATTKLSVGTEQFYTKGVTTVATEELQDGGPQIFVVIG